MRPLTRLALASSCAFAAAALPALAATGEEVLQNVCSACHVTHDDGRMERIDAARKTPEGWDMTVTRMMRNHGVSLTDEERIAVVRHLSETRGLSIAETEGWRYILEREPVATDSGPNEQMTQTCARCHSYARVALQRRTPEDWAHLVNFHLGQYPSLEYQALARDRDWWGIAQAEIIPFLAKTYPLGEAPKPFAGKVAGQYVLAGRQPGRGDYTALLEIGAGEGDHAVTMAVTYADGSTASFTGSGRIIGAGEWRASLSDGQVSIRQVFALQDDGKISGRWFEAKRDVIGGRVNGLRADAAPAVLAVQPPSVKVGVPTVVRIAGPGLAAPTSLPEGAELVASDASGVTLRVTAGAPGPLSIGLGDHAADLLAYAAVDRVSVVPDLTISRLGDGGGPIPKTPAQFEAMGWLNGPDGQPATEDDVALGILPATWSVTNFDAAAAAMEDAKFAGSIDAATGLFTPAEAGPNPERPMMTNNAGNLKVIATVKDGTTELTGEAHLYATVQRFVDAPIR